MKLTDRFEKARGRFSGHHPNVLMLLLSVLMLKHINTPEKILAVTFPVFVNACKTVQALKYIVTKPFFLLQRLAKIWSRGTKQILFRLKIHTVQ